MESVITNSLSHLKYLSSCFDYTPLWVSCNQFPTFRCPNVLTSSKLAKHLVSFIHHRGQYAPRQYVPETICPEAICPETSWGPVTTQGLDSITVHLTPLWGCVTTWICKYWGGPNIVDLTPSWGPVTTQIYFSLEEWPKDWVLLQFIWPHVGVVLQPEFVNINGVLTYLTWPQVGVLLQPKYTFLWKNDPRILLNNSSSDPKLGSCWGPKGWILLKLNWPHVWIIL